MDLVKEISQLLDEKQGGSRPLRGEQVHDGGKPPTEP